MAAQEAEGQPTKHGRLHHGHHPAPNRSWQACNPILWIDQRHHKAHGLPMSPALRMAVRLGVLTGASITSPPAISRLSLMRPFQSCGPASMNSGA